LTARRKGVGWCACGHHLKGNSEGEDEEYKSPKIQKI